MTLVKLKCYSYVVKAECELYHASFFRTFY
uniref:Uncharacterized protein n=1 Tax=Siphoviridae sp. ct1is2 TaxID=2826273 RepID=A0A8S5NNJ7_9CAUD|nr:MAG TPA: hypothetical protein [Siphoviridae sp. ct1is2]